jgi:hypothetical protein
VVEARRSFPGPEYHHASGERMVNFSAKLFQPQGKYPHAKIWTALLQQSSEYM